MKKVLIVFLLFLATGCGKADRWVAGITGNASHECVGGVEYLQFTSGASVAYTPDGKVKPCK